MRQITVQSSSTCGLIKFRYSLRKLNYGFIYSPPYFYVKKAVTSLNLLSPLFAALLRTRRPRLRPPAAPTPPTSAKMPRTWRRRKRSLPSSSLPRLSYRHVRCSNKNSVLRIRIGDPVPFWPLDPGWVKNQDPDPGWTTRVIFPRAYKQFFG